MMWIWIGLQYCMMTSSVDYFTVHVLNDVDMDWSTVLSAALNGSHLLCIYEQRQ